MALPAQEEVYLLTLSVPCEGLLHQHTMLSLILWFFLGTHTFFFSLKLDLCLFSPHCFLVIKVIGLGTESLQIPQSSLIHSDHLRLQLPMSLSAENIRWKIPEAA